MHRAVSFLFLLTFTAALAAGCGSGKSGRPSTIAQPDVNAFLVNPLFFGSGIEAPATIEVRVQNRAQVPITLRRIELDSPGMGQYTLLRKVQLFNDQLAPGETKAVTVFATAIAQTTRRPSEPLTLRAILEFRAGEAVWREVLMARE